MNQYAISLDDTPRYRHAMTLRFTLETILQLSLNRFIGLTLFKHKRHQML